MRIRIPKGSDHAKLHDVFKRIQNYFDYQLSARFYSVMEGRFTDKLRTAASINVKITFEEDKRKRIRGKDRR